MKPLQTKRSFADICAQIVKASSADDLSLSTIIFHVNLNRKAAKKCLDVLINNGLLEARPSKVQTFSSTEKGLEWLKKYRTCLSELRSVDMGNAFDPPGKLSKDLGRRSSAKHDSVVVTLNPKTGGNEANTTRKSESPR